MPAFPGTLPAPNYVSFDKDWHFNKGDTAGAEAAAFDDSKWRTVSVPHDWSIEGPFEATAPTLGAGAFAPSGVAWYRKSFTLQPGDVGKSVAIELDGVMANSDVYINGFDLGHRPYGYVELHYDLTGHLNPAGQANVIAVRTDTSAQPASRYYFGAGIVRHTRLVMTDPVHIDVNGTFVTTPKISETAATVHVKTTVINTSKAPRNVSLAVMLTDPQGKQISSPPWNGPVPVVEPGKTVDIDVDVPVDHPTLWDLSNPARYTATATISSEGAALDHQTVSFGIRDAEFKSDTGFWLNGKNYKLKGECLHAEAGGLGLAVPEDEWIHRLSAMKALGCNAVRTAHNPPSPEFLSACDKVGMLVMDEMFDCWTVAKTGNAQHPSTDYHLYFKEWNLKDTEDTVRRDRNHPSIVLYSAGNEIHDTPKPDVAIPILKALVETFHANDPTRSVTQALFRPNSDGNGGAYHNGLAALLDVVGTNYRDAELLAAQKEIPGMKIVGTEQGRTLAVWATCRDNPSESGQFIWTGVDYLGETFAFPSIGAAGGVLDDTDYPKAEALQRAAWWCDRPVVYMARAGAGGGGRGRGRGQGAPAPGGPGVDDNPDNPMPLNPDVPAPAPTGRGPGAMGPMADGTVFAAAPGAAPAGPAAAPAGPPARGNRGGRGRGAGGPGGAGGGPPAPGGAAVDWTPANLSPHPENVQVYSNCDEVELFLNDKSLGSKPRGDRDSVRMWTVPFEPGTLKAVAKNGGKEVASNVLVTADKASKLSTTSETRTLYNDFDSLAYVAVNVTDAKGTLVPTAKEHVTFSISGPGEIAAVENSQLVAQDFRAPEHDTYNGRAVVFVRATGDSGKITLTAKSPTLGESTVTFDAAPAVARP